FTRAARVHSHHLEAICSERQEGRNDEPISFDARTHRLGCQVALEPIQPMFHDDPTSSSRENDRALTVSSGGYADDRSNEILDHNWRARWLRRGRVYDRASLCRDPAAPLQKAAGLHALVRRHSAPDLVQPSKSSGGDAGCDAGGVWLCDFFV